MRSLAMMVAVALLVSCVTYARPAAYETELVLCSERASSLHESIRCENEVRARYGRPPRIVFTDADGGLR